MPKKENEKKDGLGRRKSQMNAKSKKTRKESGSRNEGVAKSVQ